MNPRGVTFNGTNLETGITGCTLVITGIPDRPPTRSLNAVLLARTDFNNVVSTFYTTRKLNIQCYVRADTRALLDTALDALNKVLAPKEKTLVVPSGSTSRQYTVTFVNMTKTNLGGGYVELDLEFESSDSLGYDTALTTLVSGQNTAATKSWTFTVDGSAEVQYPTIQIIFISLTGGENKTVTLGNNATGQVVSITRTWVNDDVLIIDTLNATVKINGSDVNFTGGLPSFALGSGQLDYTDSLTTRTVAALVTYRKRYI